MLNATGYHLGHSAPSRADGAPLQLFIFWQQIEFLKFKSKPKRQDQYCLFEKSPEKSLWNAECQTM